jgi:hypothetical protein
VLRKIESKIGLSARHDEIETKSLGVHDQKVYNALADGTIRLLCTAWLRERPEGFILDRRQDLPEEAYISPQEAARLFQRQMRLVLALSYGWLTRLHCDPHGQHALRVLAFLRSAAGRQYEALFWDYGSIVQKGKDGSDRSEKEYAQFLAALNVMSGLYASAHGTTVLKLTEIPPPPSTASADGWNSTPYEQRGWPKLEHYAARIMVGVEGESDIDVEYPKLLDVSGKAETMLEAPTPAMFVRELEKATFTGYMKDRTIVKDLYLNYYLSVAVRERAQAKIRHMSQSAQQLRWRVRCNAIGGGLGWALICISCYVVALQFSEDRRGDLGSSNLLALAWVGAVLMILAVSPTERRLVQAFGCTAFVGVLALSFTLIRPFYGYAYEGLPTFLLLRVMRPIVISAEAAYLSPLLVLHRLPWETRNALSRIWRAARSSAFLLGLIYLSAFVIISAGNRGVSSELEQDRWSYLLFSLWLFLFAAVFRRAFRRWLKSRLARIGDSTRGEESEHTALAALFGGISDEESLELAERDFMLIPYSSLSDASDLPGTDGDEGESTPGNASLREKAEHHHLGVERSVFVSHSHHDEREKKWLALKRWAEKGTTPIMSGESEAGGSTGTEQAPPTPLLWLDVACIDQKKVDADALALLPIYVSSCQSFLMLVGETYTKRLWTVIELFCFLRMGGNEEARDRVIVLPLELHAGEDAERWAHTQFDFFRVQDATCAKLRDRERLLGCIEAGFGAYTSFNQMVRHILTENPSTAISDASTLSRKSTASRKADEVNLSSRQIRTSAPPVLADRGLRVARQKSTKGRPTGLTKLQRGVSMGRGATKRGLSFGSLPMRGVLPGRPAARVAPRGNSMNVVDLAEQKPEMSPVVPFSHKP